MPGPTSERALVLVPPATQPAIIDCLQGSGLPFYLCDDVTKLVANIERGAGLAVIHVDMLDDAGAAAIAAHVEAQPAWSDFPIVLILPREGVADEGLLEPLIASLGKVLVLEQPFRAAALCAAVRSGVRARRRQYEARTSVNALRRSEEQLRLAQSAGGIGTFELIPERAAVKVSRTLCELYGLPEADEVTVAAVIDRIHPDDRSGLRTTSDFVPDDALDYTEYRVRPDPEHLDRERWVARRGETVVDPASGRVRYVGVVYDITSRKQAEQQLHDSQAALQELNRTLEEQVAQRTADRDRMWRLSTDLMLVADYAGLIQAANPAWTRMLGYREHELIGASFMDMVHPDDRAATVAEVGSLELGRSTLLFSNRYRHKDGSFRTLSWTAVPGEGLIHAVARDVTEQHAAQADLERTQAALRQAQKMEAVGQLTGGIAHDFNNLLTGIIGGLDIVRRRIASGRTEDVNRFIDAAVQSGNKAASLVHRLLAFSRRQSLDPKPIAVDQLVGSMAELLVRSLGERITLATELRTDGWLADTDANQLENALLNLAINARDAMPDGGTLTVATDRVELGVDAARGCGLQPGDYLRIEVGDTGAGMEPDVIERVFDPFFTTKPLGEGTGLGLSMVYGFVRQSRGHIAIDSAPGAGTRILILLPRHAGDGAPADEAPPGEVERALPGECVLVVEDDDGVRQLVVEVLGELGYRVIKVARAEPAIEVLRSDQRLDLLVTDVGLPGMNGRQLADIAREARPALKVLFMTGYAEKAAFRGGFLGSGMDLITKPFALDTLAAKLRQMIGDGED